MSKPHVAPGPGIADLDNAWIREAACGSRTELPWIDDPRRVTPQQVDQMQAVCSSCLVRSACFDFTLAADVTAGWWAGRSYNRYEYHRPPRRDLTIRAGDAA
jgi:hypothetical protein